MNKFFNCRKYYLNTGNNQYCRTTAPQEFLSHDVWNFFYPNDPILKGDGYVIHHKNGDSTDNRIENLQKKKRGEHSKMHSSSMSGETKQKISDGLLGHVVTDKAKQKMSDASVGNQNALGNQNTLGKHWSLTERTKQKMKNSWTNERKKEERKAKLGSKNPNWKGGKKK